MKKKKIAMKKKNKIAMKKKKKIAMEKKKKKRVVERKMSYKSYPQKRNFYIATDAMKTFIPRVSLLQ